MHWRELGRGKEMLSSPFRESCLHSKDLSLGNRAVNGVAISAGRAAITQRLDAARVVGVRHVARCDAEA